MRNPEPTRPDTLRQLLVLATLLTLVTFVLFCTLHTMADVLATLATGFGHDASAARLDEVLSARW
ncbi:MAG: hypothetical protein H6838_06810 [Planctomycetes bacterium]|nr:hypothetical protein [Planctomycetota bacterium]